MFRHARPMLSVAAMTLAVLPLASAAQTADNSPPQRVRSVTLTGNEKCPESKGDEIVVCNRINPDEQYRIPKNLRSPQEVAAPNQSWVNKTASAEQVGRTAAGLPNTCSVVGTGGQTGCALQAAQAYAAEKRAAARAAESVP